MWGKKRGLAVGMATASFRSVAVAGPYVGRFVVSRLIRGGRRLPLTNRPDRRFAGRRLQRTTNRRGRIVARGGRRQRVRLLQHGRGFDQAAALDGGCCRGRGQRSGRDSTTTTYEYVYTRLFENGILSAADFKARVSIRSVVTMSLSTTKARATINGVMFNRS